MPKTKTIHFSDGSTMQVDSDEPEGNSADFDTQQNRQNLERVEKETAKTVSENPPVDPKQLPWGEWMKHYSSKSGSAVVGGLENAGESLAYHLGITTPKYQNEIDEYERVRVKKISEEEEAKAWASTGPTTVPIVMEQIIEKSPATSENKLPSSEDVV